MGWLYLSIAIVSEVIGTTFLKRADGNVFTYSGLLMMVFYAISFTFLAIAIKCNIELGVGYAIWSGTGTALIAIIGIYAFGENSSVIKFLCTEWVTKKSHVLEQATTKLSSEIVEKNTGPVFQS